MKCIFVISVLLPGTIGLWAQNKQITTHFVDSVDQEFHSAAISKMGMMTRKALVFSLITKGTTAMRKNDFPSAEQFFLLAVNYTNQLITTGVKPRYLFTGGIYESYTALAGVYQATNNLDKAEQVLLEAKANMDLHLPGKSIFRTPVLVKLGEVYSAKGELGMGEIYFNQAEKIFNRNSNTVYSNTSLYRSIQVNRFEIAFQQGDLPKARKALKRMSTGGMDIIFDMSKTSQVPMVFLETAKYHLLNGNYKEASWYLDRSRIYAEVLDDQTLLMKIRKFRFLLFWQQKDLSNAIRTFSLLSNEYKNYISHNFPAMNEPDREKFYATLRLDFQLFNSFFISNAEKLDNTKALSLVYDNQLFSKALLLNQISKVRKVIMQSSDQNLRTTFYEWESSRSELASLYFTKKRDFQRIKSLEEKVNVLETTLTRATSLLHTVDTESSWKNVARTLQPNEVALEIIRVPYFSLNQPGQPGFKFADSISYLFLTVRQGDTNPSYKIVSQGKELEGKSLKYYSNSIRFKEKDTLSFGRYWQPIEALVRGAKRVYVSADGVYNQVSLNSMYDPQTKQYLMDQRALVLLTNTKDLLIDRPLKTPRPAVFFGRPDYSSASDSNQRAVVLNDPQSLFISRSSGSGSLSGLRDTAFDDLPGTEQEVESIEQLVKTNHLETRLFLGPTATEYAIKRVDNPFILHIATHGFFIQEKPYDRINAMLRSGLVMAGVNNPGTDSEDGLLTAYEVTGMKLDSTFLVVLSACETGLGEVKNGEGVYGLQRGIMVAGARFLLMSLWKVDDRATRLLMVSFYTKWLNGEEIHEALRSAKQKLREQYPEPYYWAGFILLGK